ncbi:MAG: GGDEF domain-containing protein [Phycisphaerales bacterium]|nr:GGDEF domain-containing protein [Phycisphaerales bacterium]
MRNAPWLFAKGVVIGACGGIAMTGANHYPAVVLGLVGGYLAMTVMELTRSPAAPRLDVSSTRLSAGDRWLEFLGRHAPDWAKAAAADVELNQLIREGLRAAIDAERVRVLAVDEQGLLAPLGIPTRGGPRVEQSSPELVAIVGGGPSSVTPRAKGGYRWRFGVTDGGRVVGVVEAQTRAGSLCEKTRASIETQIEILWRAALAETSRRTQVGHDVSTGVLGRAHWLERGDAALQSAAARGEPALLMCVAVEGLRGLDDNGEMRRRDTWVDVISRTMRDVLRDDDLIGRFADDRFVILLSRMDERLGAVVARKIIARWAEASRSVGSDDAVAVRVGMTPCLKVDAETRVEHMLARAVKAVDRARSTNAPIANEPEAGAP